MDFFIFICLATAAAAYMGTSFPTPFAHFDPNTATLLQASYHGQQQHGTPLGTTYYAPPFFYWPYSSPPVSPTTCYNHPAAAAASTPPFSTAYHQAMYSLDLISAQINFASQTASQGAALSPPAANLQLPTPPPPTQSIPTTLGSAETTTKSTLSPQVAQAQAQVQIMPTSTAAVTQLTPQSPAAPCHHDGIAYVQQQPVATQAKAQIMTLLQFKQFSTPTVTPTVAVIPTISATTPISNKTNITRESASTESTTAAAKTTTTTKTTTTINLSTTTTSSSNNNNNINTVDKPDVETMEACAQTVNQQPQFHQKFTHTCNEKSQANIGNGSNMKKKNNKNNHNKNNNNNNNNNGSNILLVESEGRCKDMLNSDMLTIDTLDINALNSNSSSIITTVVETSTTTIPTTTTYSLPTHKHIAPITGRAKQKVNKVC